MKIGGRVIQNKRITVNNDIAFKAVYKSHHISVDLVKLGHTNKYDIAVRNLKEKDKRVNLIVDQFTHRCTIREAIIFALDRAFL